MVKKKMKTLELKSALKTKTEWKEYVNTLHEAGKINLDGFSELLHAINDSDLED